MTTKKKVTKKATTKKVATKEEPIHVDQKVNISETKEFKDAVDRMSRKVAETTEGRKKELQEKDKEIEGLKKQLLKKTVEYTKESDDDLYIAVIRSKANRVVAIQGGIIGEKKAIDVIAKRHRGEVRRLV